MSATVTTTRGLSDAARREAFARPFGFVKRYAKQQLGAIHSTKLSLRELGRNRYYAWVNGDVTSTREGASELATELRVPLEMAPLLSDMIGSGQWTLTGVGASDDRRVITCKIYLSATQGSEMQSLEWAPGSPTFSTKVYERFVVSALPDLRRRARIVLGLGASPRIQEIEVEHFFERTFDLLGAMDHVVDALAVREIGGSRTSLDFNVGRSEPTTVEHLEDDIGSLARALGIEEEAYRRWSGDFATRSISRISTGLDGRGHPFVTLYDSTPLHELMSWMG